MGQEAGAGARPKAGCVWACGWDASGKDGACKCLLAIRLPLYRKRRSLVPKHPIYTVI